MFGGLPIGSFPYGSAPLAAAIAAAATQPIIVLSPKYSDVATIAASSQVTTLPAANLQNIQPKKKWRTDAALSPYIEFDFGASGCVATGLALIGHNLSATATLRLRGSTSYPATSSPLVDTRGTSAWPASGKPTDPNWPQYLSWLSWSNAAALRYWRLDILDPSNPDGYVQAGRIMLGAYWQPTLMSVDVGGTLLGFDQIDIQINSDYGETFTDQRNVSAPRLMDLNISAAERDDVLSGIAEIRRLRGMWGDVAVLIDPGATTHFHRHSMQGVFVGKAKHTVIPCRTPTGEWAWTTDLPLREVI